MLKITFKKKKEEDKKIQNKENKIKQFLKTLILKIDKVELALVVLIKKKTRKDGGGKGNYGTIGDELKGRENLDNSGEES